ncbi:hypothetical protein KIW84_054046 [Lathyrus oleraceus]|uniref:Uncharacterized protein n=1 Tax=Pisum sativum TaxID=3888 RepID=A0A9D4WUQ7_PEA|nr:hypothetical protein KIW84_054046 [Pisum sativum]
MNENRNEKMNYNMTSLHHNCELMKANTPSPFKSKCLIIALHSLIDLDSPIFLNILFKLFGVIKPHLSLSLYISNASFKSLNFSSSPPSSIKLINSDKLK